MNKVIFGIRAEEPEGKKRPGETCDVLRAHDEKPPSKDKAVLSNVIQARLLLDDAVRAISDGANE